MSNFKNINTSAILCFVFLMVFSGINSSKTLATNKVKQKPNIILIYIDDLAYSDVGCYGREFGNSFTETPNIDRLASQGMKFTNAYASAPICSPSRAALLTGKTPARLGFEFVTKYEGDTFSWDDESWKEKYKDFQLSCPPYTTTLVLSENTIAEELVENGYETGMVGKWHVAPHHLHYNGWSLTHGPKQQGFEWAEDTFGAHPYAYTKNDPKQEYEEGEYPEDELTQKAIEYLGMNHEKPFFLFVSHYFVHTPIDDRLDWLIQKYRDKASGDKKIPERVIQYAAFVDRMDHYVGQLLDAIDQNNLTENTLAVFTSDNGGHPAFAFNRPFRGSKWNLYEGGVREPFIVRWPGVVKEGSVCNSPIIQMDLMPTFSEISGNDLPMASDVDGQSILPLLKGKEVEKEDRTFIWHFPYYHPEGEEYGRAIENIGVEDLAIARTKPQSAIRKGNYKLIYFYDDDRSELYDLSKDISESNDLSKERPWDTAKLKLELFNYLNRVNARYPRKNIK
ncbi:sulfatase [Sunxiuqinia sp. A32]|uniref:sulfatase n=1 Tax=Sunxiuqinia sp. A32 TaxID=3461496 RepID=UPI0040464A44